MNYMLFDKRWFIKHQKILLFLLNTPVIKQVFRRLLFVHVPRNNDVFAIHPNAYFVKEGEENGRETIQACFSSNKYKYSILLLKRFAPLWYLIHCWDGLINAVQMLGYDPIGALNLGFDTLTAYPNADTTAPVDASWSYGPFPYPDADTAHDYDGATGDIDLRISNDDFTDHAGLRYDTTSTRLQRLRRGLLGFDTSAMGAGAVASEGSVSLKEGDGATDQLTGHTAEYWLVAYTGTEVPTNTDFEYTNFGTTELGGIAYGDVTSGYNEIALNSNGLAYIDPTGNTNFGTMMDIDANDALNANWESGAFIYWYHPAADSAGTDDDPKLDLTYTVPTGTATKRLLTGVGL